MISVLLVDDHASVRRGLRYLLETAEDIQVQATAADGLEAIAQARLSCPDVAVVDISMPLMDGIEAARQILEACQYTRVMMLSIFDNPEYVQRAIEVGARGFVLKDTIASDLLAGVRAIYRGKRYFSLKVAPIAERFIRQQGSDSWVA